MALQSPFSSPRRESDAGPLRRIAPGAAALARSMSAGVTTAVPVFHESESRLIVGPNIKLKGVEITDCDTLLIEGSVEASMGLRAMHISERGSFTGSAEVETAEIRGHFEGVLSVRETLVIHATGRVCGRVRYGRIVVEEGGQLSGEVESGVPLAACAPALESVAG